MGIQGWNRREGLRLAAHKIHFSRSRLALAFYDLRLFQQVPNKKQNLVALRFEVSQVPKSEAPGAPSFEVNACFMSRGSATPVGD